MKPIIYISLLISLLLIINPHTLNFAPNSGTGNAANDTVFGAEPDTTVIKSSTCHYAVAGSENRQLPDNITGACLSGKNTTNLIIIL